VLNAYSIICSLTYKAPYIYIRSMTLSSIDSLLNKATLDPYGKYLTFINTFTVEPDRAEALLQALKHSTEEIFRSKTGFISVNLHMSRDHKRVVNYAQRQSKDGAFKTPEVQAHIKRLASWQFPSILSIAICDGEVTDANVLDRCRKPGTCAPGG
jgi:quinol monooxygenase YgiN